GKGLSLAFDQVRGQPNTPFHPFACANHSDFFKVAPVLEAEYSIVPCGMQLPTTTVLRHVQEYFDFSEFLDNFFHFRNPDVFVIGVGQYSGCLDSQNWAARFRHYFNHATSPGRKTLKANLSIRSQKRKSIGC